MIGSSRRTAGSLCLIALVGIHLGSTASAETVEAAFVRLAEKIPFVNYDDLFYQRTPRTLPDDPRIEVAATGLTEAMAVAGDLNEFSRLAEHSNPRVRTLAMIRLYCMEQPDAFIAIQRRMSDRGEAFPTQSVPCGNIPGAKIPVMTESRTVGRWATWMMEQIGFPGTWKQDFEPWRAGRIGNPDWVGWYDFLYLRASGGTSPLPDEYLPRVLALKERMETESSAVRAWFWFGLADDALSVPLYDTAVATKEEILAAGKELGPEALLAFLRDGSRAGLREPKVDNPTCGRQFILSHGGELFRREDAAALAEMGHLVTAADANPAMASRLIREAIASEKEATDSWDRARAVAALVDLRGDEDAEFVVKWIYDAPVIDCQSSDPSVFFTELMRREPKQWQGTLREIVAHPGFEKLAELDVTYTALFVNQATREKVVPDEMLTRGWEHEVRGILRKYFALPAVNHPRLAPVKTPAEKPLWSLGLNASVHHMVLSPCGKMLALAMRNEAIRLIEAETGRETGVLEVKGSQPVLGFRKSDGLLQVVDSGTLTTWDVSERRMVSQHKPESDHWDECAIDLSGERLANRGGGGATKGITVFELPSGKRRWLFPVAIRWGGVIGFSADGQRLVASDAFSHDLYLFDSSSPTPLAKLAGHSGVPGAAYFSPDGRWLATLGGGKILIWDARTGELRNQFLSRWLGGALCFSADSQEFVTHSDFNQMARYDLQTGEGLAGYEIRAGHVSKVLAGEDGKHVFMVLEGAGSLHVSAADGITAIQRLPGKEGEPPCTTLLECWPR